MIKIIKNFLKENEIKILNQWTYDNYQNIFFRDPGMDLYYQKSRLTTRGCGLENIKIQYPNIAYKIQKRLLKNLNIKNPIYPPPFYKGIVNGIGFENGSIFQHKDPIYFDDRYTLHCNFITQKPVSGGITIIENTSYNIEKYDALVYIVSHLNHEVTSIVGNLPRILWCYGFCITENEMNYIFK